MVAGALPRTLRESARCMAAKQRLPPRPRRVPPSVPCSVLVALILAASVANMNLAVANAALLFHRQRVRLLADGARPRLRRILAGARNVAARPGRARRPVRTQADAGGRPGAIHPGLCFSPPPRRRSGSSCWPACSAGSRGDGLPDDTFADHGPVVGGDAHPLHRPLVRHRRGDDHLRCPDRGGRAAPFLVGVGVPDHGSGRGGRALVDAAYVPSHVNETTDPVDNLGGTLSVVFVAALVLAINFARRQTGASSPWGWRRSRWRPGSPSSCASGAPGCRCSLSSSRRAGSSGLPR